MLPVYFQDQVPEVGQILVTDLTNSQDIKGDVANDDLITNCDRGMKYLPIMNDGKLSQLLRGTFVEENQDVVVQEFRGQRSDGDDLCFIFEHGFCDLSAKETGEKSFLLWLFGSFLFDFCGGFLDGFGCFGGGRWTGGSWLRIGRWSFPIHQLNLVHAYT